jgi:diphosphoinositol-polyphosphate diphosphatase
MPVKGATINVSRSDSIVLYLNRGYSGATGARMVAGTIVLNNDKSQVLVVSSEARPDCWVIPKGGIETDESDPSEAAIRETWEEGGCIGTITKCLGIIEDTRPPKSWSAKQADGKPAPPRTEFHFYEMAFEKLEDQWPEGHKRRRKWMAYSEAKAEMLRHDRKELALAIDRSSIVKD